MKLSDLEDALRYVRGCLPDDADPDVLLATQPSYPISGSLRGVALQSWIAEESEYPEDREEREIVWLVEGSGSVEPAYAPRDAWEVARR